MLGASGFIRHRPPASDHEQLRENRKYAAGGGM